MLNVLWACAHRQRNKSGRGKRCAAGRASHAGEAKKCDGINRQLEIALVMARQLIVFHRQNHRRLANTRQTDTPLKMTSA
jgi:hypothetical protein